MSAVSFRPVEERDLEVVAGWLAEDHVRRWWPDPQGLDDVRAKYLPCIRGEDPTELLVVRWHGRDVGLLERYRLIDHPDWVRAIEPSGLATDGAAGIDYLIADPALVGRGAGTEIVGRATSELFEAHPDIDTIIVAPQAANRGSCRVLEKNGYELAWIGILDSDDPADSGPSALYVRHR